MVEFVWILSFQSANQTTLENTEEGRDCEETAIIDE